VDANVASSRISRSVFSAVAPRAIEQSILSAAPCRQ
jgi:hypothetical protein